MNQIEENKVLSQNPDLEVENKFLQKSCRKRFWWIGYVILLLLVMAGGAGAYYLYGKLENLHQRIQLLEQHVGQTESVLDQQQTALEKLSQANHEREGRQLGIEIENLLNAATFHLTFGNNVVLSRQLLEMADQQIAQSQSPEWMPLREALAKDISALNSAAFDLTGLAARVSALQQEAINLANLPLSSQDVSEKSSTTEPVSQESKTESWSKRLLDTLKGAFSKVVFISKDAQLQPALLTRDQRLYLISNIQSELLMAQWAAIQRQSSVYTQSLSQVEGWLKQYFPEKSPVVQNMLKTLGELKNVSIVPVPTISNTLQTLQKIRATS